MEGRPGKGQIGVIGAAQCFPEIYGIALPKPKVTPWSVAGGITIGILPTDTDEKRDANPYVDIVIPTGLGRARNVLVVHAPEVALWPSDALVVVAGGGLLANGDAGTLAEIALALKLEVALWPVGSPIVGIKTWELGGRLPAAAAGREAVGMLMGMRR